MLYGLHAIGPQLQFYSSKCILGFAFLDEVQSVEVNDDYLDIFLYKTFHGNCSAKTF